MCLTVYVYWKGQNRRIYIYGWNILHYHIAKWLSYVFRAVKEDVKRYGSLKPKSYKFVFFFRCGWDCAVGRFNHLRRIRRSWRCSGYFDSRHSRRPPTVVFFPRFAFFHSYQPTEHNFFGKLWHIFLPFFNALWCWLSFFAALGFDIDVSFLCHFFFASSR